MTMHNLRYLKITQDLTDEDAGWGLFVDLETDCAFVLLPVRRRTHDV